jgi:hypothetical protein
MSAARAERTCYATGHEFVVADQNVLET